MPTAIARRSLAAAVAAATGVARAAVLMRDDHYGWFEREARGIYRLTPKGRAALQDEAAELVRLGITLAEE